MNVHNNARLTPKGREAMARAVVDEGLSYTEVARIFHNTPKTVAKWAKRYREPGVDGLRDRSSRPISLPSQTPSATCELVEGLRRKRYTMDQIAGETGQSRATVSPILKRAGTSPPSAALPASALG